MRILVITDSYPPHHSGGYEIRCKDVLDQLILRGHDIEIITTIIKQDKPNTRRDNGNIHRELNVEIPSINITKKILNDYQDIRLLNKKIKSFQPEIIYLWHVFNLSRAMFPFIADLDIPIVFDEGSRGISYSWNHRGAWYYFVEHESNHDVLNKLKPVVIKIINALSGNNLKRQWTWPTHLSGYFNSKAGMDYAKTHGLPLNNYPVIPSGLDLNDFTFKQKTKIEYPIHILLPGRISDQKGQSDIVQLLNLLTISNKKTQVTIIGSRFSKTYFNELLRDIEKNGFSSQVSVLPEVKHEEMEKLYQSADICFFPSYQQYGLSRIPLEAMASGCLVITYGNEGSSELIENNETGFIVPEGDFEEIIRIIKEMIAFPNSYMEIIQKARQKNRERS